MKARGAKASRPGMDTYNQHTACEMRSSHHTSQIPNSPRLPVHTGMLKELQCSASSVAPRYLKIVFKLKEPHWHKFYYTGFQFWLNSAVELQAVKSILRYL